MTDEEMSEWNWFSSVPFKLLGFVRKNDERDPWVKLLCFVDG